NVDNGEPPSPTSTTSNLSSFSSVSSSSSESSSSCSSVSLSSPSFFSESASFLRTISSFSCGISLLSSSVDEDFCNRKYATKIIPITRTTTITVGKKEKTDAPLSSRLERSNLV